MDKTIAAALIGVAFGSAAPWPVKWLARLVGRLVRGDAAQEAAREASEVERMTARINDLEDLIDLLRKALDRHLVREGAIASACELLIALAGLVHKPTPAMLRMRDRAQQLLEDARAQTTGGGK